MTKDLMYFAGKASALIQRDGLNVRTKVNPKGGRIVCQNQGEAQIFHDAWNKVCAEICPVFYYLPTVTVELPLMPYYRYGEDATLKTLEAGVNLWVSVTGAAPSALMMTLLEEEKAEMAREEVLSQKWYLELADVLFVAQQVNPNLPAEYIEAQGEIEIERLYSAVRAVCMANESKLIRFDAPIQDQRPELSQFAPEAVKVHHAHYDNCVYYYATNAKGKIIKPLTFQKPQNFLYDER
jgi:hypothetical protein